MSFLYVFVGGGLGAALRHGVALLLPAPWATQVVNIVGSLLLGYLTARGIDGPQKWLWGTGLCGGFTTYSTFNNDTLTHLQQGQWGLAAANVMITLVACFAAGALGVALGRQ